MFPKRVLPRVRMAVVVGVLCASAGPATAVIRVPADVPTIAEALPLVTPGDSVLVAPGTYFESSITADLSSVKIVGETGDPGDVIIDAAGGGSILRVETVNGAWFRGLTLQGASHHAISVEGYTAEFDRCVIRANPVGIWSLGRVEVRDCEFLDNTSRGMLIHGTGAWIERSVFARNGEGLGGDRFVINTTFVRNCLFRDQAVRAFSVEGGGIYLTSCTLFREPGIYVRRGCMAQLERCILYGTGPLQCTGAIVNAYCTDVFASADGWGGCLSGQQDVHGNFSADPLFCAPNAGDLRISSESPCAPGMQPTCVLIGAYDVGCGSVSLTPRSWGRLKSLYR